MPLENSQVLTTSPTIADWFAQHTGKVPLKPYIPPKGYMKKSSSFLLGCDPEFFVLNTHTGAPVSSIDRVGGSKDKPLLLGKIFQDDKSKMFCLEDNVLVEINVPPANSASMFDSIIRRANNMLLAHLDKCGLGLSLQLTSHIFDLKELSDPRAFVFGCDPDYNAWTGQVNPRPFCKDVGFRSAGGHLHIGIKGLSPAQKRNLVQWLDLFVGCPLSVLDEDIARKKLYGKGGAMRYKPYGLEYRVPSNFWTRTIMGYGDGFRMSVKLHRAIEQAIEKVNSPVPDQDKERILLVIDKEDHNAFEALTHDYNLQLVEGVA